MADLAEFTDAELAVVRRFVDRARASTNTELHRLRTSPKTDEDANP